MSKVILNLPSTATVAFMDEVARQIAASLKCNVVQGTDLFGNRTYTVEALAKPQANVVTFAPKPTMTPGGGGLAA